jgi:uncharacterized membrane protein
VRRRGRGSRLDQPRLSRRTRVRPGYESDAFGRLAERVARFIGTARFLAAQSVVIVLWIVYNVVVPKVARFDPFPFIFLTLVLSLQAAYAAPLILLAQNRQDDRDRANLAQDREQTVRTREDTEYLAREIAAMRITIGELATRDFLRAELRVLLGELDSPRRRDKDRDRRDRRRRRDAERGEDGGRELDRDRDNGHAAGQHNGYGDGPESATPSARMSGGHRPPGRDH